MNDDDDRRYSREEVALVLRKVAERSPALAGEGGLTRAELNEVVTEAGLELAQVDRALAELTTQHKAQSTVLGLRQYALVRRQVPGQLTPAQLQRANKLINREIGIVGASELDDQGLSWFGRHVSVTLTQERGHIAISLEERFHNTARGRLGFGAMASLMAGAMSLVGLANAGLEPVGVIVAALLPLLTYGVIRKTHERTVLGTQRRLELLGDQLEAMLGEGDVPAPLEPKALGPAEVESDR